MASGRFSWQVLASCSIAEAVINNCHGFLLVQIVSSGDSPVTFLAQLRSVADHDGMITSIPLGASLPHESLPSPTVHTSCKKPFYPSFAMDRFRSGILCRYWMLDLNDVKRKARRKSKYESFASEINQPSTSKTTYLCWLVHRRSIAPDLPWLCFES